MKRTKKSPPRFRIGDRVRLPFDEGKAIGIIVEDRGPVGMKGRHIYGILWPMDPDDPERLELSEDHLEPAGDDAEATKPLDKAKVIKFLKTGGLLSILWSNIHGGKLQPRVWLCRNNLGNVTYTFYEERGLIGGQTVPAAAIRGERVFKPKRDQVLSFLKSFGLDDAEAESVLASVGTSR